ncbi:MAG TPA: glycosyltransferase [bacterium]|nr:glycosyltransferase [bacterium]
MSRFLVVAPYVPHPVRHGGAIRSRVLLDALQGDHELHLAVAVADEADAANARALACELDAEVHTLPASQTTRSRFAGKLGAWLTGRSELAKRRWRPDARSAFDRLCVHLGEPRGLVDSTWSLPVVARRRWPLFLHNLEYSLFARADGKGRPFAERISRACEARALRRLERAAIARAPVTVTVSEHDRNLALALCPAARVEVVPNSVDLSRLPLLPAADANAPPRLLFVGSLDYPPNLEAVTELVERHLPALRAAFPELVVRLVGKDPAGLGVRFRGVPGVELVGPVDDVVEHYRTAHAVFLPIRSGGGTRIKILEAWALGVPVVATRVAAEGLPADDGVHLLRFETPGEGVEAVRRVLAGGGEALRQNGRALVEQRFSHAAAIEQLSALFREAVS